MKINRKDTKGITLIALIVTIIVLLILAGVTMVTLTGDGGILGRANTSALAHKKAEYYEDIKMEVSQEHIERIPTTKEEAFITSLQARLNKKEWVQEELTIACDEENIEHSGNEDYLNTMLILTTKENYEIIIDVDNGKETATIRDGTFVVAGNNYKIVYNANAGGDTITGDVSDQEVRRGFYTALKECAYQRAHYAFVGWCEDSQGTGTKYSNGDRIQVNEDKTMYAIWEESDYKITLNPNGGNGENEIIYISATNPSTTLPANTFTKNAPAFFAGWNTQSDGTGTNYGDEESITISGSTTLYAQWETEQDVYLIRNGVDQNTVTRRLADIINMVVLQMVSHIFLIVDI